jgi:hypothetical protein
MLFIYIEVRKIVPRKQRFFEKDRKNFLPSRNEVKFYSEMSKHGRLFNISEAFQISTL